MARILWMGDAGCHTGFARVTHSIGERLVLDYGHDVTVLASNYSGDFWPGIANPNVQPLKLYTAMPPGSGAKAAQRDVYGARRVVEMLYKVEPDVVIMLNDAQPFLALLFDNPFDPDRMLLHNKPIIFYVASDGTNLPPRWTTLAPQVADVIAMSKFGQSQYVPSDLAYHGVDGNEWWPVESKPIVTSHGHVLRTKGECKRAFGYDDDDFLVGRVDTNSGRKDFAATWKALVPVMKKHKNIKAHFHCSNKTNPAVELPALFSRDIETSSRFTTPSLKTDFVGWPQADMNALVNAFDVVVSTSRGEGFGFSNAEALACGVPVIAQNVSAIPEVVGPGGILIDPQRMITAPTGQDNWLCDIDAFSGAIETLYDDVELRRKLGIAGHEHVMRTFSWEDAAAVFDRHINQNVSDSKAFMESQRTKAADFIGGRTE